MVKRTGDKAIIEFRSAVDAVRCSIEIQDAIDERNAGAPERGDLMGDGVNIAAHLEEAVSPGTICLSEQAYRLVKARLDLAVADPGETKLKNIAELVRAYLLQVGVREATKPAAPAPNPAATRDVEKPSIAATPFQDMSGFDSHAGEAGNVGAY